MKIILFNIFAINKALYNKYFTQNIDIALYKKIFINFFIKL